MKKIHFLIPPADKKRIPERIFGCNYGFFPQHNIFILYPLAILKKEGYQVELTDCVQEGLSLDEVINQSRADIFVFYSVFLSREIDLQASNYLESKLDNPKIIYLGPDSTYYPEKYLLKDNRYIVRGENDTVLTELMNELNSQSKEIKTKGISWISSDELIHNSPHDIIKDLDQLPFPDRQEYKKMHEYNNPRFKKFPSTTMLTSRGCFGRCTYCVPNSQSYARELEWRKYYGKKPQIKVRSADNVIAEFKEIAAQGFKSVSILDDQFLWDRDRTFEIMDAIKDLKLELSILTRCDCIKDEELTEKLHEGGVRHVDFGVESFCQKILDDVQKDIKVSDIHNSVRCVKKAKLKPEINILLGASPLETKETIKHTFSEVEKLNVDIIHAQICNPFPGTKFYDLAQEKGWMTEPEYRPLDPMSETLISYPHLSDKDMLIAVKTLYQGHYFKPAYIIKQFFKIRSLQELLDKIKTALNMRRNILKK